MTHRVEIYSRNERGEAVDVLDVHYYCSDYCAKTDAEYDGWNGCNEIHDYPFMCNADGCSKRLDYYRYDYETGKSFLVPSYSDEWGKDDDWVKRYQ
jgi:hypothetical protein